MNSEVKRKANRGKAEGGFLGVLRLVALIALLAGATGSVVLMLDAGRRTPRFLLVLFLLWVLSPFTALIWANMVSKRWPVVLRTTLYSVMLVIALGSLAAYAAVVLGPPRPKPAFVFVVVPPVSWLLTATAFLLATLISRRQSRRGERA